MEKLPMELGVVEDWENDDSWKHYQEALASYNRQMAVRTAAAMSIGSLRYKYDPSSELFGTPVVPEGHHIEVLNDRYRVLVRDSDGMPVESPPVKTFPDSPLPGAPADDATAKDAEANDAEAKILQALRAKTGAPAVAERIHANVTIDPEPATKSAPSLVSFMQRWRSSVMLAARDFQQGDGVVQSCTAHGRLPYILLSLVLTGVFLYAIAKLLM